MVSKVAAARVIAFYLPQFHPTPENDEWWGKGFTEWTNTAKAKPLFRGHYQPHVPADLGFYDLRLNETRIAQAEMAGRYGIEAFCYYHYWFGGKRLLERPFNEVLASGEPEFPFCLCWANHSWTGIWAGSPGKCLIEQVYPGVEDHRQHFFELLRAFTDHRYLTVDGKPLFLIYDPMRIPEIRQLTDLWRKMAEESGLKGLYLVGVAWQSGWNARQYGFDASTAKDRLPALSNGWVSKRRPVKWLQNSYRKRLGRPTVHLYENMVSEWVRQNDTGDFPCVIPNWDNTPRSGTQGLVLHRGTPELFRQVLRKALENIRGRSAEERLVFVKSWNEWAEGNHLEPDMKFGKGFLEVIGDEMYKGSFR
ncbi:MAG TPA: glycoside hydrolase family 99-like domain-containing protein [Syntrophorhabdaceae bacterium]|jgi:lipopolysaccharide biosynthesis protein